MDNLHEARACTSMQELNLKGRRVGVIIHGSCVLLSEMGFSS